jgi:N-acetylmuramic acid 6-phosphate (MurNAc-6-P) etherase
MSRITESANDFTSDLDVQSPAGILRLLRQVDAQLFAGFGTDSGMFDASTLTSIGSLAEAISCGLRASQQADECKAVVRVVISGSGTSGRLAFFVARAMNALLVGNKYPPCVKYLISGGDKALLRSQEGCVF